MKGPAELTAVAQAAALPAPPPVERPTRPFYWSVRRELWENRSICLAPLAVGVFAVVGLSVHAVTMPTHMGGMLVADPASEGSAAMIYKIVALLLLLAAFVTGAFYSLEALGGERRDRSILFWKSLPVADRTTVLAKAFTGLVVLPVVTVAVIVAAQLILFLLSTVALVVQGQGVAPLWRVVRLPQMWLTLLYMTVAIALWHAPLYAFLLLVSGWARRTAALWAVLPLLAAGVLEKLTLGSEGVAVLLIHRIFGWYEVGLIPPARSPLPIDALATPAPARLLGTPGLWTGLALAAALLAAAVRLRRYREPV